MLGESRRNEENVPHFFQSMLTAMTVNYSFVQCINCCICAVSISDLYSVFDTSVVQSMYISHDLLSVCRHWKQLHAVWANLFRCLSYGVGLLKLDELAKTESMIYVGDTDVMIAIWHIIS